MSGKDQSVVSKEALMSTKSGKQIIKQGLFKSKGFRLFSQYKEEAEAEFPKFAERFTDDLLREIKSDVSPASTQTEFAQEVGTTEITLQDSQIPAIKSKLENREILRDRVLRILNSNFVKMTLPVFNALYDAAAAYHNNKNAQMRQDLVDGHIIAIDLSEPMDRIMDKDEDLEYLDDYKLMNPYILKIARAKIAKGGEQVLQEFEDGFKDARLGQYIDTKLKMNPRKITEEQMNQCYKKYRAVMGTAGRNMALAKNPLGELFYLGMARAAECVGCGNEIEDSIKNKFVKVPSWPLYYTLLTNDVKQGFDFTMKKSELYLSDARLAMELLPKDFTHSEFLEFLFLTVEHYNQYWYNQLGKLNIWSELSANLPR
ncbi:hypothetical protein [Candidatus Nitrosotenuis uzonensis]|uniref:Uncharacterized protein n=1 Tax=Candidatus Nitrosotenuis uzonensis TaxID=1407055 RepID=A0A812F271_9ARCH|nr:hypothetical protein [Candidatus Nitrosotenuis uzonensis]MCA2003710.1 hypothetical protein [Candidatus Nitrosotenuis sp.]CAE6486709.1 conserved hypothetical protein [Candidatus Nitrosotenuis uzonensis]